MNKKIIFCNCGGNLMKPEMKEEIFHELFRENISFIKINDLCGICITRPNDIRDLMNSGEEILIAACYPRAVKLLLEKTGVSADSGDFSFLNFIELDSKEILDRLKNEGTKERRNEGTKEGKAEISSDYQWPAWFPVIDYARCTSCGQCADFCLFGVYEKREQMVYVVNPEGCKNNCPACARICPHTAIVFPKYELRGSIAGDDNINEIEEQQRQRMDIDSILGSEIYQALEKRKLKRQSIIRNSAMQEAMLERDEALKENERMK